MSRVTCHMSHATCHLSCIQCPMSHFFLSFFSSKWWSQLVEGLLLTGPTPSSFIFFLLLSLSQDLLVFMFFLVFLGIAAINCDYIERQCKKQSNLFKKKICLIQLGIGKPHGVTRNHMAKITVRLPFQWNWLPHYATLGERSTVYFCRQKM